MRSLKFPSYNDFNTKYLDPDLRSLYPSDVYINDKGEIYHKNKIISLDELYHLMLRKLFISRRVHLLGFPHVVNFANYYKNKEIMMLYPKNISINEKGELILDNILKIGPIIAYHHLVNNIIKIIKDNY